MAFSRATSLEPTPAPDVLTARRVGIGMNFAAKAEADADIESTLVHASVLGMDDADFRVLAVLTTWLGVHHMHVNADRRLARLVGAYGGAPIELLPTGTEFQVKRRGGEDERFTGSKLRVPKGTLRDRQDDVLSPEVLVRRHPGYRNRVPMGPSFRADVWTALERAPDMSVADIARKASCSFATAWQAAQD